MQDIKINAAIVKMAESIKLSDDDRSSLKEIISAIGFTQKALAEVAGVDQPWLSQTLSGKRQSVDSEILKRVTDQLVGRLRKGKVADTFSEDRIQVALAFLSRFSLDAGLEAPKRVDRPLDLIPLDAPYYVSRDEDKKVLDCLSGNRDFAVLVSGPAQCGKSSLIKGLQSKARSIGIQTAWLHPVLPLGCNDKDVSVINASTAAQFAQTLKSEWGLDLPRNGPPQGIEDFLNWIKVALAPTASKPRLLVIDDFSAIGAVAVDQWITRFLRAFWNDRSDLDHRVSLAIGQTFYFNQYFEDMILRSSVVNWTVRFHPMHTNALPYMKWFTQAQVKQMCDVLNPDGADAREIHHLFEGQPYLTHAAIQDKAFHVAARHWTEKKDAKSAACLRGFKPYQKHKRAVERALVGPSYDRDKYARELLINFFQCRQGRGRFIPEADKNFLLTSMLVDEFCNLRLPLYELFAEDLNPDHPAGQSEKAIPHD